MSRLPGVAAVLLAALAQPAPAAAPQFDVVIEHGHIIDGTGSPWYEADLGIREGRIAAIGRLGPAGRHNIDARGLIVAPGFIDMLGQSELSILVDPRLPSKIYQGITTEITGEGDSVAPLNASIRAENHDAYAHLKIEADWQDFAGYFARLERQHIGINVADYIGATTVREMVIGYADRQPTAEELTRMQVLVDEAMRQGAVGLSSSLEYAPAPYAKTEELIALATAAAQRGGVYATHMRSEGEAEKASLEEVFRIGREAHIPLEIFHLKVSGRENWGKAGELIAAIETARAAGLDVAADTYAYTAWENSFSAFIPPWAHDGGNQALIKRLKEPATRRRIRHDLQTPSTEWDNEWQEIEGPQDILITAVNNPQLRPYQGRRLSEVAAEWHLDGIDALCEFLIRDHAASSVAVFGMSEPDVRQILSQPWVSVDNDSSGAGIEGLLAQDNPHPRGFGTFPRILHKYVRDEHLLGLSEAIRKFSALAAQRVHLADRGVLKVGLWADVVVFDASSVREESSYEDPKQLATGMQYVLVNGTPVIAAGHMTGALPGHVLRGPGYQP